MTSTFDIHVCSCFCYSIVTLLQVPTDFVTVHELTDMYTSTSKYSITPGISNDGDEYKCMEDAVDQPKSATLTISVECK